MGRGMGRDDRDDVGRVVWCCSDTAGLVRDILPGDPD